MKKSNLKGYLFGLLTAICWATSSIFFSKGLLAVPSSAWATAIGLAVATSTYLIYFFLKGKREDLRNSRKEDLVWQLGAGMAGGLGILFRNQALESTRVAIVLGLVQLQILFTMVLGPALLPKKDREPITPGVILGAVLIVGGSFLILYGRSI